MTNVDDAVGGSGPDDAVGSSRRRTQRKQRKQKKSLPLWQETLLLLGLALVLALLIKSLFLQAFYIPSPSMEPEFIENDRILVQKVSYWGEGTPERGDIIVFEDPGSWLDGATESPGPVASALERIGLYPAGGHLVKRVIGVGGDRVICCDAEGRVTINGTPLDEGEYLPKDTVPSTQKFDVKVPEGHLWMMGDNRGNSYDSRGHQGDPGGGFVDQDLVVGKVFTLIWPMGRAEIIHRPKAFADIPDPN